MRPITLEHAVSLYLAEFPKTHAASSFPGTATVIRQFQRHCTESKVRCCHEIQPFHVTSFLARFSARSKEKSIIRCFLRWAKARFRLQVYVPPSTPKALAMFLSFDVDVAKQIAEQRRKVSEAAERLVFPHQRVVFLCGYLYGLSLAETQRITLSKLLALPKHPQLYQLLEDTARVGGAAAGPFLHPWMGSSPRTAEKVWKGWAGLAFRIVMKAGSVERLRLGIKPVPGRRTGPFAALREMSDDEAQRIPWPWEPQ